MRLGLDVSPLARNRAGIGNYIVRLLESLIRYAPNHEYFLYTTHPILEDYKDILCAHSSVKIIHCHPFWMKWVTRSDRLDLFHGLNFKLRASGIYGGVVSIYDLAIDRLDLPSRKLFGQRLSFVRTRRTARRATRVVTISEQSAVDIMELYGVARDRISLVSPAVGPEFYPVTDQDQIKATKVRCGLGDSSFILAGGGSEPRKNISRLIEALGYLNHFRLDTKLVVVGGMGHGSEAIYETVRRTGLSSSVIFPGFVALEDLRALYSSCRAFVFPSLYEGFGMPVLEAMACGAPVVTSKVSSLPEVAGDAAIFVDPLDSKDIAGSLVRILEDVNLQEDLRHAGKIRARAFTWEKSAQNLFQIYSELVSNNSR